MNKSKLGIKKKGISMVALVVTIIVLIILTLVIVITGVTVPKQAQLAIFYSNVDAVQELVNLKMHENLIEYAKEKELQYYKWVSVANNYTQTKAQAMDDVGFTIMNNGPEDGIILIDRGILDRVNMQEEEKEKYFVSEKGVVYYSGFEHEGKTYYNKERVVNEINVPIESQVQLPGYTIIYNGNGADNGNMSNEVFPIGIEKSLTANAFTKEKNCFIGWSLDSSAFDPTYSNKQVVLDLSSNEGDVVNLYAIWTPYGDIDRDGDIDIIDSTYIGVATSNKNFFNDIHKLIADLNQDGEIDKLDVFIINQYQVGNYTSFPIRLYNGDVNLDGVITMADVDLITQYLANTITFTPEQTEVADVNKDNVIDETDKNLILEKIQ